MEFKNIKDDLEKSCEDLYDELNALTNQRLLLTGSAGFLGFYFSHLFAYWNMHYSNRILCTLQDNFSRGRPSWLNNISRAPDINLEQYDVLDYMSDFYFENVIHAASIASPVFYRRYPIETMDANVIGLRNLLDAQLNFRKNTGVETRFLYFSTSEIYGDPSAENIPTSEEYRGNVSCTGPRASYDESKRYGETLCVNFWKSRGLPVTIVRPFNNYGPGLNLDDGRAISDYIKSVKETNSIVMYSDGTPTRTFCYISDAISGYIKALVNGSPGESYNIGNEGPEISMLDLAYLIKGLCENSGHTEIKIIKQKNQDKEYLTDNPNRRCPNISKAKTQIGFSPSVELEDGLRRTLRWNGVI